MRCTAARRQTFYCRRKPPASNVTARKVAWRPTAPSAIATTRRARKRVFPQNSRWRAPRRALLQTLPLQHVRPFGVPRQSAAATALWTEKESKGVAVEGPRSRPLGPEQKLSAYGCSSDPEYLKRKLRITRRLREETTITLAWIAQRLRMRSKTTASATTTFSGSSPMTITGIHAIPQLRCFHIARFALGCRRPRHKGVTMARSIRCPRVGLGKPKRFSNTF